VVCSHQRRLAGAIASDGIVEMKDEVRAACVMGWPVTHSRSPLIHGTWIELNGIAGVYRHEEVRPESFPAFLTNLAAHGYVGGNVTVPFKEVALTLTEPDERASAIGAANTVWLEGNQLRATNTDATGFIDCLDHATPGWDTSPGSAVVIGAGGAARGIVFGILERGIERIYVANRTQARAEALRHQYGARIYPTQWHDIPRVLGEAGLLVNTTSLGMVGQTSLDLDLRPLPDHAVVADAVYAPLMTPLLRSAERRGLRIADGLGMLLYQAVPGFELWFGVRPEVTAELRALVARDLEADL